jgi:putative transposase
VDWRERSQRRPVINESGHAHELTFSCFHRFKFLQAERTCEWLADAINEARKELDFSLWAFVFMPEHVHLVVYPRQPEYDVSLILKAIKEPVGRKAVKYLREHAPEWIPRSTVKRGQREERHFWEEGGGDDRNVNETTALLAMIEYIHLNPVRRRLVAIASEWKWSSASWYEGKATCRRIPDPIPPGVLDVPPDGSEAVRLARTGRSTGGRG